MTEITPFPENNYETVLLDRPWQVSFFVYFYKFAKVEMYFFCVCVMI